MYKRQIVTRYADNLLPSPERSTVIIEQLLEQEKKSESALGRESALLVAYMGYQRGDAKLVAEGLDDFSKRIATDASGESDRALFKVLSATWTAK